MRRAIVAGVVAAGILAPPAHACTRLPAPSGTEVRVDTLNLHKTVKRTALRVCVRGRQVTLARATQRGSMDRPTGARIGAASAAGHRVAWIEEHDRHGRFASVVTVARVGRRAHVLRRFTVERRRTRTGGEVDVLLTREGELAYLSRAYGEERAVFALERPNRPTRRLSAYAEPELALEDGRTLRWHDGDFDLGFLDLRRRPCPSRSRYAVLARNGRVILTRSVYGGAGAGITVVRGCDPSTGRDRVVLENYSSFSSESDLSLVGLDRHWAVFLQNVAEREDYYTSLTVVDALTGGQSSAEIFEDDSSLDHPAPSAAAGFAVSERGVLGWLGAGALYALTRDQKVVEVDEGGTLAGLHAEGDALVWTHDGVPRRLVL